MHEVAAFHDCQAPVVVGDELAVLRAHEAFWNSGHRLAQKRPIICVTVFRQIADLMKQADGLCA
ncbi:hypothetical protein AJ88_23140 [Mesorhizobium amorphae CCBAU 01583]|nr:hypothetical protein AJ88_23140 [Mesorhizobium amorphae CCBAU 01583]